MGDTGRKRGVMGDVKKVRLDKMNALAANTAKYIWVSKGLEEYTDDDYMLPFIPLVQKEVYGPHGGKRDRLAKLCQEYVWRGVHENKSEINLRKSLMELDTAV